MKKVFKRIIIFIVTFVMITGCGHKSYADQLSQKQKEKGKRKQAIETLLNNMICPGFDVQEKEELNIFLMSEPKYHEDLGVVDYGALPSEPVDIAEINTLGEKVLQFINKTYELDWEYSPVDVRQTSEMIKAYDSRLIYMAAYVEELRYMLITPELVEKIGSNTAKSSLVHELIHYITHINLGRSSFIIKNEEGQIIGDFLHEAITEEITYAYMESIGVPPLKVLDGEPVFSGYELLLYNVEAIDIAFDVNFVKEALHGNIDGLKERMESKTGDDSTFERVIYMMDIVENAMSTYTFSIAYNAQEVLTQLCFFVAESEQDSRLITLTEDHLTRLFFIDVKLKNSDNAIGAWQALAQICDTEKNSHDTLHHCFYIQNKTRTTRKVRVLFLKKNSIHLSS